MQPFSHVRPTAKYFVTPQSHQHSLSTSHVFFFSWGSLYEAQTLSVGLRTTLASYTQLIVSALSHIVAQCQAHTGTAVTGACQSKRSGRVRCQRPHIHTHTHTCTVDASRFSGILRRISQRGLLVGCGLILRLSLARTRLSPPCATAATQSPQRSLAREADAVGVPPEFFSTSCRVPTPPVHTSCEMHHVVT